MQSKLDEQSNNSPVNEGTADKGQKKCAEQNLIRGISCLSRTRSQRKRLLRESSIPESTNSLHQAERDAGVSNIAPVMRLKNSSNLRQMSGQDGEIKSAIDVSSSASAADDLAFRRIITKESDFPTDDRYKQFFAVHNKPPALQPDQWEQTCIALTKKLEFCKSGQFLAQLVVNEFEPQEYYYPTFSGITFAIINKKLNDKVYAHPFSWQHDIRSLCSDVLCSNPMNSTAWKHAVSLCYELEFLCRKNYSVNPYATFNPVKPILEKSENVVNGEVSNEKTTNEPLSNRQPVASRKRSRNKQPVGVVLRENGDVVYTSECFGTPLAAYYEEQGIVSVLPKPQLNNTNPNDARYITGLSNAQKNNLPARFKVLDISYRYALLNWLKDELGIHPLLCALDIRYMPEFDIIPSIKAKKFLLNMRSLMLQQKEAQEKQYLYATLPSELDWNMSLRKAVEPDQVQINSPMGSSVISQAIASLVMEDASLMNAANSEESSLVGSPRASSVLGATKSEFECKLSKSSISGSNFTETHSMNASSSSDYTADSDSGVDDGFVKRRSEQAKAESNVTLPNLPPTNTSQNSLTAHSSLGIWRKNAGQMQIPLVRDLKTRSSSWGEWKVRAIQSDFKLKNNANLLSRSEEEARAELQDENE